eukprot:gene1002-1969_t
MGLNSSLDGTKYEFQGTNVPLPIRLHSKSTVLKKINVQILWNKFLSSEATSFALSHSELSSVLVASFTEDNELASSKNENANAKLQDMKTDIAQLISHLNDLYDPDPVATDFMGLLYSVLLLSPTPIEEKIDQIFEWMCLSGHEFISFDEFYVALVSLDQGIAHAIGRPKSPEEVVKNTANRWFTLCKTATVISGPGTLIRDSREGGIQGINKDQFFGLCTNRQHPIRRILEVLSQSTADDTDRHEEQQEVVTSGVISRAAAAGDQWLANPAWKKTAQHMTPANCTRNASRPTASLTLDWVHGYRGYDRRNNVYYITDKRIAFHAAALGILQDIGKRSSQSYFGEHTDDVISIAMFDPPDGGDRNAIVFATGEIGKTPAIHLWQPSQPHSVACMRGYHTKGVCQLAFSKDGKLLFSVGIDYTVAIYHSQIGDDKIGRLIASAQGPRDKVLHCTFYGEHGNSFFTCGEKHVLFWKLATNTPKPEPAKLGVDKNKTFMCAVPMTDGDVIVGTSDGELLRFKEAGAPSRPAKGTAMPHDKAVNALAVAKPVWAGGSSVIVSGGKDGKVKLWKWDEALELLGSSDVTNIHGTVVGVRAVCFSPNGGKVLVGTQDCAIVEFDIAGNGSVLTLRSRLNQGHFKDELWGLSVRPLVKEQQDEPQYCTVGDDHYLRIWGLHSHRQLASTDMGAMARACAYHPSGDIIAVGFGGRVGKGKQKQDGMFRIYRIPTATSTSATDSKDGIVKIYEAQEAKQWISDIKFSPDGSLLAIGSHDDCIYIYSYANSFQRCAKFSKHNSYITHLDFSTDNKYIQSNCGAYELLFSDTKSGHIVGSATALKDVQWATSTCPLAWPMQGIWPEHADGTDINAVDRSHSGRLIVTADDFGKVKLFRYPCVVKDSKYQEYAGHSAHVMNVRWIRDPITDSEYVLSVGGDDKCVFQWSCTDTADEEGDRSSHRPKTSSSTTSSTHIDSDATDITNSELAIGSALDEAAVGGDEFMAVKPWLGAIKSPSAWTQSDPTKAVQYFAALGDFSTAHSEFQRANKKNINDLKRLAELSTTVLDKMSESGVVSKAPPDVDELELEWVHGLRAFDARNNVEYVSCNGISCIVYPAGALGVLLDPSSKSQRYFRGHTDDVLSLAVNVHNGKTYVATGQRGPGKTFVWEVPSMSLLATLATGLKTVHMIAFTGENGRLLVTIGEDNQVAVSDWKNQRVVSCIKGEPAPTYHVAGSAGSDSFLSCGDKHIRLWTMSGRNLTATKISLTGKVSGSGKLKPTLQPFLCAAEFANGWVVGCDDSNVYTITGGAISNISVHDETDIKKSAGGVTSMNYTTDKQRLLTGSKNGKIVIWSTEMSKLMSFTIGDVLTDQGVRLPQIQSISFCQLTGSDESLVIATRSCDLFQLALTTRGVFFVDMCTRGHYQDELWGLCVHPFNPEYCTVGDDCTLRIWSIFHRNAVCPPIALGAMARACAYHPSGDIIAVGFGGRVGKGKQKQDGMVRLYAFSSAKNTCMSKTPIAEATDAKKWISDMKFSPDGTVLVVGGHNDMILIYKVTVTVTGDVINAKLTLKVKFAKHNSYITHVDFSADGRFMQSNCGAYELLFSETSTGRHITSATEVKDMKWATWTCTLGWPVQGIWPEGADGTDINAVDRSHSGHLLVTADDFGKVKLFRYPCVEKGAESLMFAGHSSHVMNVRWTVGDTHIISVGGNDKCIFQWKHVMVEMGGGQGQGQGQGHGKTDMGGMSLSAHHMEELEESESVIANALDEAAVGGDEFMAVKPWLGAIRAPSRPPPINAKAPTAGLRLKWVHGYTSGAIGQNLFYNCSKEAIYSAAALGVRMCRDSSAPKGYGQTYFTGHDDDITCLTVTLDGRFVATGQTASHKSKGKATVHIWDAVECRLLSSMVACHQRAVTSMCFSPDGTKLLTVGQDDNFVHTLWKDAGGGWSRVQQIGSQKSDKNKILFSHWLSSDPVQLVSGGASVHFWSLEGASLSRKQGRFGKKCKQQSLLCAANLHDGKRELFLVAGTASGDLYKFKDRECDDVTEKAHNGPILCLSEVRAERTSGSDILYLVSGSRDKCIKVWNQALQPISVFDSTSQSFVDASVSSLDARFEGTDLWLLVGLAGGEILELTASETNKAKTQDDRVKNANISSPRITVLMQSHSVGELWGLAAHPTNPDIYATAGEDSTVRIWSVSQDCSVGFVNVGWPARALAWSPDGEHLAVGFLEKVKGGGGGKKAAGAKGKTKTKVIEGSVGHVGACHIYHVSVSSSGSFEFSTSPVTGCESLATVSDVKFSPRGDYLAIGTHDKAMFIYHMEEENPSFTHMEKFNKHSSAVLHFDFSVDDDGGGGGSDTWIQSTCQAYELLFSNARTAKQETSASKLADVKWATWTCTLGWPVQGIWPEGADGTDINAVDRSHSGHLLVTADDFGKVKLFRYPCVTEKSMFKEFSGHSSHVTNVRWTLDDHLISVGGNDKCVFVWSLTET